METVNMETWKSRQTATRIAQFEEEIIKRYPHSAHFFKEPGEFYRGLTEQWNYLDAVKRLAWERLLPSNALCLDLGSGTGWLGAFLSRIPNVSKIYVLDSSRFFQTKMRPGIESMMGGDSSKVIPIDGLFTPILLPDKHLDVVTASSALHHADRLEEALHEIHRVLKDDGILFILNELPHGYFDYLLFILRGFLAILVRSILCLYKPISRAVSSSGVLDDPFLGDRRYPLWYWKRAITNAGFKNVKIYHTGLWSLKQKRSGPELVHFICRKRHPRQRDF